MIKEILLHIGALVLAVIGAMVITGIGMFAAVYLIEFFFYLGIFKPVP